MFRTGLRLHSSILHSSILALGLLSASSFSNAADLLELYKKAVSYDADIAAAKESMMAEKESENIAFGTLLPSINSSASLNFNNINQDPVSNSNRPAVFTLSVSQPVYNPANWHNLSAAEQNALRAQAGYDAATQSLILTVATAYFNVLRAEENLSTAKSEEAAVKRQYEQASEQFNVGLIAITDVHEAKASYDASQTERIRAEGVLTLAFEELSRLSGEEVRSLSSLREDFPIKLEANADVNHWIEQARQNSVEIRIADYQYKSLEQRYKAASTGHLPTVNLGAGYEFGDMNSGGPGPRDFDEEQSTIGLTVNMPLYAGGATQSRIRQSRHELEQARHLLDSAKRQASIQTRSEFINIRTNVQTVESLKQNIVSRESALQATREGYKVGTRNIVEVLDAERRYYSALRDYLNARFDYIESQLRIRRAAGTLSEKDLSELNAWLQARGTTASGS